MTEHLLPAGMTRLLRRWAEEAAELVVVDGPSDSSFGIFIPDTGDLFLVSVMSARLQVAGPIGGAPE